MIMAVQYEQLIIRQNERMGEGHWLLELASTKPLPDVEAGQFLSLRCDPGDQYSLLRPFSILNADYLENTISVYYKHLGRMSSRLSSCHPGEVLDCLFPLGNSFPWRPEWQRIALVGGGVGLAPMLYLAQCLQAGHPGVELSCFFGGNTAGDLVPGLLKRYGFATELATMDGTAGFTGTVVDLFAATGREFDVVYTCGPNPMMAALAGRLPEGVPAYASLEEYMACSVGACYGCVVKVRDGESFSNQRVCREGPVFDLRKVDFQR